MFVSERWKLLQLFSSLLRFRGLFLSICQMMQVTLIQLITAIHTQSAARVKIHNLHLCSPSVSWSLPEHFLMTHTPLYIPSAEGRRKFDGLRLHERVNKLSRTEREREKVFLFLIVARGLINSALERFELSAKDVTRLSAQRTLLPTKPDKFWGRDDSSKVLGSKWLSSWVDEIRFEFEHCNKSQGGH